METETAYYCSECGNEVFSEIECDLKVCNYCADKMYLRECERREWSYYHDE